MLIHTNSLSGNQPFLWDSYPLQFSSLQASVATASRLRACFQVSPLQRRQKPGSCRSNTSWFSRGKPLVFLGKWSTHGGFSNLVSQRAPTLSKIWTAKIGSYWWKDWLGKLKLNPQQLSLHLITCPYMSFPRFFGVTPVNCNPLNNQFWKHFLLI